MRLRLGFLQYCYRSTQQCIAAEIALERCAGRLGDGMSLGWVEVGDGIFFSIAMEQWQQSGKSRICNLNIIIIGLHVDLFGGCKMLWNILESLW